MDQLDIIDEKNYFFQRILKTISMKRIQIIPQSFLKIKAL